MNRFVTADPSQLVELRRDVDVLLVTATQVELEAVHELLTPLVGRQLLKIHCENNTYYVGRFGAVKTVVIKCQMGTAGVGAALPACLDALRLWNPRALIALGIAFGKDPQGQCMCDVLVARYVIPYEPGKVQRRQVYRSPQYSSDPALLNRFSNVTDWTFEHRGRQVEVIPPGPILSGEKVINSARGKRRLFEAFPQAIGGEMEGHGIAVAAAECRTPWILVKAICDWADGTKDDTFQRPAARAAASLVRHVLSEPSALRVLPSPVSPDSLYHRVPPGSIVNPTAESAPANVVTTLPGRHQAVTAERLAEAAGKMSPRMVAVEALQSQVDSALAQPTSSTVASIGAHAARVRLVLPKSHELVALRLIASAPGAVPIDVFKSLFPYVDWRVMLPRLSRKGVINLKPGSCPTVRRQLVGALFERQGIRTAFESRWLKRLSPLARHSDAAILLCLLHLRAGRVEEAVEVVTDVAEGLEPGHENRIYCDILRPFVQPKCFHRLSPVRQVHLLNAFALCLARSGHRHDSIIHLARLLRLSRRKAIAWGVGQAYINAGVNWAELGNARDASRCYERAIAHARRTRDRWLLGRALHNRGMLLLETKPKDGLRLIEAALEVKAAVGDVAGVTGGLIGQGNYCAKQGRWRHALDCYQRAVKIARRCDLRHLLGLALGNVGSCLADLGKISQAVAIFRQVRAIGQKEGFQDVVRNAIQGEAVAESRRDHWRQAGILFLHLEGIHRASANTPGRITALHDAALTMLRGGDVAKALQTFASSRRLANSIGDEISIYNSRYAVATPTEDPRIATAKALLRFARAERRLNHPLASAMLWEEALKRLMPADDAATEKLVRQIAGVAVELYRKARSRDGVARVYKLLCVWRRDLGDAQAALEYARLVGQWVPRAAYAERVRALDEQGCCCQKLGRPRAAERLHRSALSLAEKTGQGELIATPLNNLGLLLGNMGKIGEALRMFERAERLLAASNDVHFSASVAKNRALVLIDGGRRADARRLLQSWEKRTGQLGLKSLHASMLHGLANVAYLDGRLTTAATLYRQTLRCSNGIENDPTKEDAAQNYMTLLERRAGEYFGRNQVPAAERYLAEACRIADRYRLIDRRRTVLLTAAGEYWRVGERYYADACRTYVLAMLKAGSDDINGMLRINATVGAEVVRNFYLTSRACPTVRLKRLVGLTRAWLRKNSKNSLSSSMEGLFLWPFEVGSEIGRMVREERHVSAKLVVDKAADAYIRAVEALAAEQRPQKSR